MIHQPLNIKICGIRSLDTVQAVAGMPITYIGFVFAPSKRQVSAEQVRPWVDWLRAERLGGRQVPLTVGVFVHPTQAELTDVVQISGIDCVQFHERESPELCRFVKYDLGKKVIKAVSHHPQLAQEQVPSGYQLDSMAQQQIPSEHQLDFMAQQGETDVWAQCEPYRDVIDVLLLDTYDPVYGGGSGKTFHWDTIPAYFAWAQQAGVDLLVAGGLNESNVTPLIANYPLDGVDVSSGVETDGMKDTGKIQKFVERVLTHDSRA